MIALRPVEEVADAPRGLFAARRIGAGLEIVLQGLQPVGPDLALDARRIRVEELRCEVKVFAGVTPSLVERAVCDVAIAGSQSFGATAKVLSTAR